MDDTKKTPSKKAWTKFRRTGQVIADPSLALEPGTIWANSRYIVVMRECGESPGTGPLIWLSIKGVANDVSHDWRDFQRIKNELVGPEAEAVELYPAESRLVDNANQFHLWAFPNFRFPFGFSERLVSEGTECVAQRPFDEDARPSDLTSISFTVSFLPEEEVT
jgi:hypothetical protein